MPASWAQRLVYGIADLKRQMGQQSRPGIVYEVYKDSIRVQYGISADGTPFLSPWIQNNKFRGGARERRFFKKGMNVMVHAPNNDPMQAYVTPYAPNQGFPAPDHADAAGEEAETYQLDNLRVRKDKDNYDIWLVQDGGSVGQGAGSQPGGGSGTAQAGDKSLGEGDKALMKLRINKDGYITGRVGTKVRFAAHSKGAKIRAGTDFFVAIDGKLIVSKPPIIAADPIPNDDK